jgi:hypothetical protein
MRGFFNGVGAVLSIALALVSLCAAYDTTSSYFGLTHENLGKLIVAFWAIVPPGFFWLDWVLFSGHMTDDERKIAKHTHDLARNIWVGLVAVLTFAFFKALT